MGAFQWLMKRVTKAFGRSTNALFYTLLNREILNEINIITNDEEESLKILREMIRIETLFLNIYHKEICFLSVAVITRHIKGLVQKANEKYCTFELNLSETYDPRPECPYCHKKGMNIEDKKINNLISYIIKKRCK